MMTKNAEFYEKILMIAKPENLFSFSYHLLRLSTY